MKAYYKINGSVVEGLFTTDFIERKPQTPLIGYELHDAVFFEDGRYVNAEALKFVDGIIVIKDANDYRNERIAKAEEIIGEANTMCMRYQTGETNPRIDPNFYSTIIVGYGMMKNAGLRSVETCPCCQAVTDWINTLWQVVWVDIKNKIRLGEEYSLDFAQLMVNAGSTANPPHTFDECYFELS